MEYNESEQSDMNANRITDKGFREYYLTYGIFKNNNALDLLLEEPVEKSVGENTIRDIASPFIDHLIKILKWEDDRNYNKHVNDLENKWFNKIKKVKIYTKTKRFKTNQYFDLMFNSWVEDLETLKEIIVDDLSKYKDLKTIRSDEEVFEKLFQIIKSIGLDLSKGIKKHIKEYL